MKILVIGFQRSGTSLLRDLVERHPDVKKMWHERVLLYHEREDLMKAKVLPDVKFLEWRGYRGKGFKVTKTKVNFDLETETWGEKVPYYEMIKSKFEVIEYCKKWNDYFKEEAKILHIVRHPADVGISTFNKGVTRNIEIPIKVYKEIVPKVIEQLTELSNVYTFKYEQLLLYQHQTLKDIFKFCKLRHSDKIIKDIITSDIFRFGKIVPKRAFAFKKKKIDIRKLSIVNILEYLDEQISGVKYSFKEKT